MKTFIKSIAIILLSIGLANCGGSDNGGGAPAAPNDNGITNGLSQVDYTNGNKKVSYTSGNITDFYITLYNGFKKCLAQSADDQSVNQVYSQLMAYLSSAAIGKGTRDTVGAYPRYLTIVYSDGNRRTFNLNNESASVNEETLSNGLEISNYLDDLHGDINQSNNGNCLVGKK